MIYTADEVKNMIAKEAERWCMAFLPGHKSSNTEWRSSDILGSNPKGKSFVVTLAGEKAGLWYENGNNAGFEGRHAGHIIDIIMARNGIGFREAIEFSKKWLGVHDDDVWKKARLHPEAGKYPLPNSFPYARIRKLRIILSTSAEYPLALCANTACARRAAGFGTYKGNWIAWRIRFTRTARLPT